MFRFRNLVYIVKESTFTVNVFRHKTNSDNLHRPSRSSADQLRSFQFKTMINPIPYRPGDTVKLPAVYRFFDGQLRSDTVKSIYKSISARITFPNHLKQVGDDQRQNP